MQTDGSHTELLVLSGIHKDGRLVWVFAPGGWDIEALESRLPFSGHPGAPRRKVFISVEAARELARLYGTSPLLDIPGKAELDDLLSDELSAVKLLIARDQDVAFSVMPL